MFKNEDDFKKIVSRLNIDNKPNPVHRENLRRQMFSVFNETKQKPSAHTATWQTIRRTIMKRPITKVATAAVVIVVIVLSINVWDKSISSAYAIEQTIEANKGLRYIHVRNVSPPAEGSQDTWLEFDENGELVQMRVEEGQGEAFRIMVWANETIRWYSPPKNKFVILHETHGIRSEMRRARELVDPRFAVQSIYDQHLEGKLDIEVESPRGENNLIKVMATDTIPLEELPPKTYRVKYILLVDPKTKLAKQRDKYFFKDGQYVLEQRQLYLEYNEPIEPDMFVLEQPKEVELEDRTKGIGMPQDNMTDIEAARELVRQYIEALIAKDYAKAGKLYNGQPEAEVREWNEEKLKIKHIRIIGIGEPVAKPERGQRNYGVPFAHLIELSDGQLEISGPWGGKAWSKEAEANLDIQSCRQVMVRPVVGQPDRWVITGGI